MLLLTYYLHFNANMGNSFDFIDSFAFVSFRFCHQENIEN